MFIGYVSFYCITVQIMQFPVLDFELDQYAKYIFLKLDYSANKLDSS